MPYDRFLIAPLKTGLETDLRPWQIMDDAFTELQNAYVYRGRIRKRFGSAWMGTTQFQTRLRINIGNTPGPLNIPGTATAAALSLLQVGQMFSVGTDIFTIYQLGAGVLTDSTNGAATATINSVAHPNTVTFTGEPGGTAVFWYPSFPVMGLTQYETGLVNNHPSYAFDPYFAYVFTPGGTGWTRSGAVEWNGQIDTNFLNFFQTCNWKGANVNNTTMYVTNFQAAYNTTTLTAPGASTDDPIWYLSSNGTWTALNATGANGFYFLPAPLVAGVPTPQVKYTGPFVVTSKLIFQYKNRLVLLFTVENDNSAGFGAGTNTAYPQRARYSWNGSPLARNAWYEPNQSDSSATVTAYDNVAAGAGIEDCATDEQIVSAQFIKDRLIVYFERSTWELAYTGNEQQPFIWNKLNSELGSQGTFSTVPFDKAILTVGNSGVHSCDGSNVVRIDNKIPDEVFSFEILNNNALRIAGIRDFENELVYWTVPIDNETTTQIFCNQIMVYNYQNTSWAFNDDCFTCFGYFEQGADTTWALSAPLTWAQANFTWASGFVNPNQRQILAGTPEGFVVILNDGISRNAPTMQITTMTIPSVQVPQVGYVDLEVINHNCAEGDYVAVENTTGITLPINGIYQIYTIIDRNNFTIYAPDIAGAYLGGGTVARVSNILIQSKQWNPYDEEGRDVYLAQIDFGVQKTDAGQLIVDYSPSATEISMVGEAEASTTIMGNNILETSPYDPTFYPLEQFQDRLWHRIYFQSYGECIQITMFMNNDQMTNRSIVWSDFELEGIILFTNRVSTRLE